MEDIGISDIKKNPFAVHSPDTLESVPADYIVNLFVEEYTRLPAIEQQKHTFVWGSRGSGKSFILRYMEPQCQEIRYGSMADFLNKDDSFIGVYFPCKNCLLDKTDLDNIDNSRMSETISEHLLNISIVEKTIYTIQDQIPSEFYEQQDVESLIEYILLTLDGDSIEKSRRRADIKTNRDTQPLDWLRVLLEHERNQIFQYLKDLSIERKEPVYDGSTTGYHDFILPFMKDVQDMIHNGESPIFLLIDDAFYLRKHQQKTINTWVGNRDQAYLCMKVSADRARYDTFKMKNDDLIEKTHDFTEVRLDEQYTVEHTDYREKVREIANRRLELADGPTKDIREFLPEREYEQELLEEIKEEMREEWHENDGPGESPSNYVDKYARARLHQRLSEDKISKSYAGFDYLVHISAGRIRDFLDPCHLMFEKCVERGEKRDEIDEIPVDIQDDIIKDYSRDLLQQRPEMIRKDLDAEEMNTLDKLIRLVRSLGKLFRERLHEEDHREPRVFSFSVRDEIPPNSEVRKVIDLGIERGYFTLHTYPSKDGGGGENLYILNRRLAPVFTIDPTSFRGRIQLDYNKLQIGCKDPKEFVRVAHGTDERQESLDKNWSEDE